MGITLDFQLPLRENGKRSVQWGFARIIFPHFYITGSYYIEMHYMDLVIYKYGPCIRPILDSYAAFFITWEAFLQSFGSQLLLVPPRKPINEK